jgi:hypothetical protein
MYAATRSAGSERRVGVRLAALLVVLLTVTAVAASETQVDINALTQETQKMSDNPDEMTLIWWIPVEFWAETFKRDPMVNEAQAKDFINVLKPYTVISVVDGKMGAFGGVTYKARADIRSKIRIEDSDGGIHRPLSLEKVDADTRNFLSMMKPVMINMLGPMGQNMHFFVFPGKNEQDEEIAAAREEGSFSISLGDRKFRWKLPLETLFPEKTCAKCGEKCSGVWNFCPWCGTELPEDDAARAN